MRILKFTIAALVSIALILTVLVYLLPGQALRIVVDVERQRSGLVRKQIDLPDGIRYVYLEGGQGEPLLLLHGFGADKDNFTRVARFLTPHYRVIVPDLPGFGESAHPEQADYSPLAQAARLHDLMHALGIQNLHLGGSSMGGQIAITYAAQHPDEVKSLWLLDPAGVWSAPESELQKIIRETGKNPLMSMNEDEFSATYNFVMNDPPFIPSPMLKVMARKRIQNYDLENRIFRQVKGDSVEQRVTGLSIPALIVWGDKDRALSVATAEMLHKLMPKSGVIIMHDIGHLPMVENSQRCAEDYMRFRNSK
jgi:pimeloyl-ACP methyl ester carboxylesterase